jgi:hypothetical protein
MTRSVPNRRVELHRQPMPGEVWAATLKASLRAQLRFPPEAFALLAEPLIEWAISRAHQSGRTESLPAPAERGNVSVSCFCTRALTVRHDRILPANVPPERVGELAHRWTYAVLIAALLRHECETGSDEPARLLDLAVPEVGRRWLSEDPLVCAALDGALSGTSLSGNPIEAILQDAVSASLPRGVSPPGAVGPLVGVGVDRPASGIPASSISEPAVVAGEARETKAAGFDDRALRFLAYLQEGIANGSIEVNAWGSRVHRVREGWLLVWPDLFQHFLETHGSLPATPRSLKRLRQALLDAGWRLQDSGGSLVHEYAWRHEGALIGQLSGVVFSATEGLIEPTPPTNPHLVRIKVSSDAEL